jgi:hypothetical protein
LDLSYLIGACTIPTIPTIPTISNIRRAVPGDAEAAHLGYSELRLHTHVSMIENVALYQVRGWLVTGQGVEDGYSTYS